MKKFFKILLIVLASVILAIAAYIVYIKFIAKTGTRDAFSVIPQEAIFIVETTNLSQAWTQISKSELWLYLTKTQYFADVNSDIETVNTFLQSNSLADAFLNERKLILSAHMISNNNWDFLITVDLQDVANVASHFTKTLGLVSGYTLTKKEIKNEDDLLAITLYELVNQSDANDKIYISLVDNILVLAFDYNLIEKAIKQREDKHWENNKRFQEVITNLQTRKLFKVYFNFNQLDNFTSTFLTGEEEVITMLSQSLSFAIFDIDLSDNKLSLDGYTNLDSLSSYIKALAMVKPGKIRADEIMPNTTALYFSVSFDSYLTFYENLINEYQKSYPQDYKDMTDGLKLAEKVMGISVQDDLFNWIGTEIALFKLRPLDDTERQEDVVIAINAKDIEAAKTGLTHITDQIRKRTSIKFDVENYKNFELNYLSEKGIIRFLFGKLFDRIEKPYFTYIEDYVVMSNSKDILKSIIDDYIEGRTLSHSQKFTDFKDNFANKSNFSIFIQMPKVYTLLYHYTAKEDLASLLSYKELILSFAQIGFQLTSQENMFKTTFIAQHDAEASIDDKLETIESKASTDLSNAEIEDLSFKITLSEDTLKNNGAIKVFYPGTTDLWYEGTIKNNLMNGIWRTYYESGNLQNAVNYKEGKVEGTCYFYYDGTEGTTQSEATFENELITEKYKEFYDNGAQKALISYKEGQPHGDAEFYYKTGKLKIEAKYKNGTKDGKWKYYDENGKIIDKEKWKKDEKK